MPVFDSSKSGLLLREFEAVNTEEGEAVRALRAAQESGADVASQRELMDHMLKLHEKKMSIWEQLKDQSVDK